MKTILMGAAALLLSAVLAPDASAQRRPKDGSFYVDFEASRTRGPVQPVGQPLGYPGYGAPIYASSPANLRD